MKTLLAAVSAAGTLALAACNIGGPANGMTSFTATERPENKAELFAVPADQISHLQIAPAAVTQLARTLRLTGTVAYNGFLTTPVLSPIGGPVSRILVMPGDHVKAGQPMLYVASPDFSLSRSAYVKARDAFQLADKVYKRAQDLYAHGAIAQADVEQAESSRTSALADLQSSEQAIKILGVANPDDLVNNPPAPEIAVPAPRAGEVVERLCAQGQLLQAATTQCFTLSDMSSVWVLVNVYQNDIGYVHVGDHVTITTDAYPDVIQGKIEYVGAALDPTTRTLPARIAASNPGGRLKKDMYVTADVQAGAMADALVIPDAAVLRDAQNMPYVYVQSNDRQFARRNITIGDSQNGRTQVLTGLQPADRVVGDGSLFLQFQNSNSSQR